MFYILFIVRNLCSIIVPIDEGHPFDLRQPTFGGKKSSSQSEAAIQETREWYGTCVYDGEPESPRDGGADNRFGMLLRWFWSISGGAETNQQTIWTWTWKWSSSRSRSLLEMFQFKLEDSGTSVRLESDQQKLLWRSNSNWTHRLDRVDSRLQSTSLQYFSYQFGSHFQSTGPNPAYVHRWCPT